MNERVPDPRDPVDVAALAELDAGLPDAAEAAARRRGARADPRAAEVLDALAATRAELAAAGDPELPPEVAARWAAALAAEPTTHRTGRGAGANRPRIVASAPPARLGGRRCRGRCRRCRRCPHPRPAPPALAVSRVDLVAVATSTIGTMDVGDLADPARREACLRAVLPAAAGQRLLGGRRVVLDGEPGVLLVLATGTRGGLHVVTVDPDCGPAGGALLAQVRVG